MDKVKDEPEAAFQVEKEKKSANDAEFVSKKFLNKFS